MSKKESELRNELGNLLYLVSGAVGVVGVGMGVLEIGASVAAQTAQPELWLSGAIVGLAFLLYRIHKICVDPIIDEATKPKE